MKFALYDTSTGIISVILYKKPTNKDQLNALVTSNLDFVEVSDGINPANSLIDLDTKTAIPTGPVLKQRSRYFYNEEGIIHSVIHSWLEDGHPDLSLPKQIVSNGPIPYLTNNHTLTLDDKGVPVKDNDGNYVNTPPEVITPLPDKVTLLFASAAKKGDIDSKTIPDELLAQVNASLAAANIDPIN